MDADTDSRHHHRQLTNGKDTWRARCPVMSTPGSGGGSRETAGGNAGNAPVGLPRAAVRRASATTDGEPVLIAGDLTIDLAAPIRSLTVPPTNCG